MPQTLAVAVENNFTKGYITESTGLNFPENAATDTDNCRYTIVGDVLRRQGIDFEDNFTTAFIDRGGSAVNTFKWSNAGGDGQTQLLVVQAGPALYFYNITAATNSSPLSQHFINTSVDLSTYTQRPISEAVQQECQFAEGNGYLFVFHPSCEPFYCVYASGVISSYSITVRVRDFVGANESNVPNDLRPTTLSDQHLYNLLNQGWTQGGGWSTTSTGGAPPPYSAPTVGTGVKIFTVPSGLTGISGGDFVNIYTRYEYVNSPDHLGGGALVMSGSVTSYVGTSLTVNITSAMNRDGLTGSNAGPYDIIQTNKGFLNTWVGAEGNYPSNSDVWWYFKNSSNVFDPATTQPNVSLAQGRAPQGHYILDAFNQQRSLQSGISSLSNVSTTARPRTGAWFQGRVWYTGIDDSEVATSTTDFYTWTGKLYFSQTVSSPKDFGNCYQVNDPTSENLNDILPTDGGEISIPEAGSVYKLFPIQNGMLIFAANGVWFLTGSRGIGFAANDYTITKISAIQTISSASFVDVFGLPYFWNEEGIYMVTPRQNGGLTVESITVSTIDTFYDGIPVSSKKLARGAFNPIEFTIQWIYKDTEAVSITDAYAFNRIMNYNVYNKAFFPFSVSIDVCNINGISYVAGPGGLDTPDPAFRYFVSLPDNTAVTWAFEHDESYYDWSSSGTPVNYTSYFITGFKLRGQAIRKFQPQYIQVYRRVDSGASAYKIQGIWDYSSDPNSGRWSTVQVVDTGLSKYSTLFKRHKIRGRGYALQFKVSSVDGKPFDIQGWAVVDTVNQGV